MDFTTSRTIEITSLALNGLQARQHAIAANSANVMTPDYQRKEVVFEDQLQSIIAKEDIKKDIRLANSAPIKNYSRNTGALSYNVNSLDAFQKPTSKELEYLNENTSQDYKPEIFMDLQKYSYDNNNNVSIEQEMMDMAKTGMQYNVLTTMQSKMFSGLLNVIKGTGQ